MQVFLLAQTKNINKAFESLFSFQNISFANQNYVENLQMLNATALHKLIYIFPIFISVKAVS